MEAIMERMEKLEKEMESLREKHEIDFSLLRQIATEALLLSQENTKNINRLSEKVDRLSDEMRAFKDEMRAFKDEMLAFKDEMRAFKDEMKAFKNEMLAFKDEMRAFKDEMNRKWGELANRLGTLAEDIFGPGVPYLVERFGYRVLKKMPDVEYRKAGRCNQYDMIVVAGNGDEVVFVAEVKNKLRPEDFDEFRRKLENLPLYEPEWEGRIVPILAAFSIPEDLLSVAHKRGVLLVRMGGDYLEPLNPEVVKKKEAAP